MLQPPPPGTDGDTRLVRTSLPLVRENPRDCPRGTAVRARPFVRQSPERSRRKPVEDFALGPVMAALDAVELDGASLESALDRLARVRKYSPGHVSWAREAVHAYLAARHRSEAGRHAAGRPGTVAVREEWTSATELAEPDARGILRYERTAWGRRYASRDGGERELWLLSVNTLKRDRPTAEIAEAASVLATGTPSHADFGDAHRPAPGNSTLPRQVRVIGVGCGDGEHEVLADWDAARTQREFTAHARPALARVVTGTRTNPGSECVRCEALAGCPGPPETPGLLGAPGPRRPRKRRSVSVSDLRTYERCPALFHLTRVLHLRSPEPESGPVRRGRAVDAWLNHSHARRGCARATLPEELPGLAPEEQAPALAMLAAHVLACPLDGLGPEEKVEVQKRLTTYDPELDTVVVADPDLLYTRSGGWVWHETKTAGKPLWEGRPLLESYPQLALAVLLMSAGVPGGDPRRSLVELEVLYETGSRCEEIDPGDPDTLAEARQVIARLATPWAVDEAYEPRTGDHCGGCEMLRHCAAGQARVSVG
ncbi:PD-(D/E)XK nuclease family protein [Streptomyces sp. NBC_00247]|uniref:PD-(D/E)XK nuclease family protein n=1 Tax=Streptomyces sp. NBC_00247 TaxID=2975689 RepID=UPI002E2B27EE|nr:PD-(D/E)XK nuclease family protein [Streptomyces sp. NBC_00247]